MGARCPTTGSRSGARAAPALSWPLAREMAPRVHGSALSCDPGLGGQIRRARQPRSPRGRGPLPIRSSVLVRETVTCTTRSTSYARSRCRIMGRTGPRTASTGALRGPEAGLPDLRRLQSTNRRMGLGTGPRHSRDLASKSAEPLWVRIPSRSGATLLQQSYLSGFRSLDPPEPRLGSW